MTADELAAVHAEREAWEQVHAFAEQQLGAAVVAIRAEVGLGELGRVVRGVVRAPKRSDMREARKAWQATRQRLTAAIEAADEAVTMLDRVNAVMEGVAHFSRLEPFLTKMTEGA